ncbi:MAG: hypothetical protein U1E22_05170 [Coriobacteriia bacterium]|nr:hypothetical protein [Coriobacteriia bacterium]
MTDPLDHETTLEYDANGNLTKTTWANAALKRKHHRLLSAGYLSLL